ncbi:MAG: spoVD [Firmicutes bacterium]|nr:spoVD [Bacillota bacterium]
MRIRMGRRMLWLGAVVLLIVSTLGGRLYRLQVTKADIYARTAFQQRTLSLPVNSGRGLILDRHGVPLADPQRRWGVAVFPQLVQDRQGEARALANTLGLSEDLVSLRLATSQNQPLWLVSQVSAAAAAGVQAMGLPGIAADQMELRYGREALARHLLGYVNDAGGQLGLERAFNQQLAGDGGAALVVYRDGTGRPLAGLGIHKVAPATGKQPYNLYTTIDAGIQSVVEQALGTQRGAAVVLDPATGEVLAMASRPQYTYAELAQLLADSHAGSELLNRAVTAYAPGSVFKAVVAAAALDSGKVSLDEHFYCPGHYEVGGHTFTEAGGGHGDITFREAVAKSCNITFLKVGYERLGIEGMRQAALRFGFGSATGALGAGTAWADEQPGRVPAPGDGGAVQMAFGQGELTVTPLQVARAFAAIANGGTLPPVRLVTALKTAAGEVVGRPEAGAAQRVISEEAAAALQRALVAVTDPRGAGTGKKAWVEAGGAAGKTGSAEATDDAGHPTVHAWFAGYLPAAAPRYVVVVMAEGGGAGGAVAAPIFNQIGTAILARS